MKNRKWSRLLALALILVLPLAALAETGYGAAALSAGQIYTVEEMLTYALQDEYLAQAEYRLILESYPQARPFVNIVRAEGAHIARLLPLFEAQGVAVPQDSAAQHLVKPASLEAAWQAGVDAEEKNIAMYESFLKQDNLPDDVRQVFAALMRASQNHLRAFTRQTAAPGGKGPAQGGQPRGGRGGRRCPGGCRPAQGQGRWGN
ncbi:MAG: DUF2202 domain-containing protein [Christensenellales bacterium]